MRTIATIGVYGFTVGTFLAALRSADVQLVIDVRQRRGVRGSEYAWANSQRLQEALAHASIAYEHRKELAPTTELRRIQSDEDDRRGVGRRSRIELAPEFARLYTKTILDLADLEKLASRLPQEGIAALLCVERDPEACHRSLIATRLAAEHGATVVDLMP